MTFENVQVFESEEFIIDKEKIQIRKKKLKSKIWYEWYHPKIGMYISEFSSIKEAKKDAKETINNYKTSKVIKW